MKEKEEEPFQNEENLKNNLINEENSEEKKYLYGY